MPTLPNFSPSTKMETMSNKLTAAVAAMYFGCKFKHTTCINPNNEPSERDYTSIISTMKSLDEDGIYNADYDLIKFEECQLILKPLSEIKGVHATEIAKILEYPSDILETAVDTEMVVEHLEDVFSNNSACYSDYVSGNKMVELINYLRSHSYDVDGLIATGIAITSPEKIETK